MIIHLKENVTDDKAIELAAKASAIYYKKDGFYVLITGSAQKKINPELEPYADAHFAMSSDIQLASKDYRTELREITLGKAKIGA